MLTATSPDPVADRIEPVTDPVGLDWRERAACAGYPHKKGEVDPFDKSDDDPKWEVGKSFCNICPVRAECLEDALEQEGWRGIQFRSGLRGGLTPRERINLKHRTAARDRRQGDEAA